MQNGYDTKVELFNKIGGTGMNKMIINEEIETTQGIVKSGCMLARDPEFNSGYTWGRHPFFGSSSTKHGRSEKQIKKDRKKKKANRRKH